jgi:hypothetical protein
MKPKPEGKYQMDDMFCYGSSRSRMFWENVFAICLLVGPYIALVLPLPEYLCVHHADNPSSKQCLSESGIVKWHNMRRKFRKIGKVVDKFKLGHRYTQHAVGVRVYLFILNKMTFF